MGNRKSVDVLVALLGTSTTDPLPAQDLVDRLARTGRPQSPADLLTLLLELEAAELVAIDRHPRYCFALTAAGARAAYEAASGRPVQGIVLVVDLVGFTTFTETHGDAAARDASRAVRVAAEDELRAVGGQVIKSTGDGVLALAPPGTDVVAVARGVRRRIRISAARSWAIRVGAHEGAPVEHDGDIFGADVNLAARLCELAGADELVVSVPAGDGNSPSLSTTGVLNTADGAAVVGSVSERLPGRDPEVLQVRGLADAVAVVRRNLCDDPS